MSRNIFGGLKEQAPAPALDLSAVSRVEPPPVAPDALRAAQAGGEAMGFRSRGGQGPVAQEVPARPSRPAEAAARPGGRVRVREMRAAKPEIGRGMQKASFTALVPVDIMERFIALESTTGARRWHLLELTVQLLEQRADAGALKGDIETALQAWSAANEG